MCMTNQWKKLVISKSFRTLGNVIEYQNNRLELLTVLLTQRSLIWDRIWWWHNRKSEMINCHLKWVDVTNEQYNDFLQLCGFSFFLLFFPLLGVFSSLNVRLFNHWAWIRFQLNVFVPNLSSHHGQFGPQHSTSSTQPHENCSGNGKTFNWMRLFSATLHMEKNHTFVIANWLICVTMFSFCRFGNRANKLFAIWILLSKS